METLAHFVVENLNYLFYFFDFNVPFPIKIGGTKDFIGRMSRFGEGDSDGWRFGPFLTDRDTTQTHP